MLYHLFQIESLNGGTLSRLFEFITFRAGLATVLSLIISMLVGGRIIKMLQKRLSILVPCLLFAKLNNIYIILLIITTLWLGLIGFIDDYIKVFKKDKGKDKGGLSGKFKILGQVILGLIVGVVMLFHQDVVARVTPKVAQANGYEIIKTVQVQKRNNPNETEPMSYVKTTLTNVPFIKGNTLDYKYFVSFLGDNSDKWVWIIFIPMVIYGGQQCRESDRWFRRLGNGNVRDNRNGTRHLCLCFR